MIVDQAASLRALAARRHLRADGHRPERIVAVGSGKGGVGKTTVALNLAIELAARGRSTYLIDADFGMANVNIMAGIMPRYNLSHLLERGKRLEEILVPGPCGVRLIPGSNGFAAVANLTAEQRRVLCENLACLGAPVDYLLIDVGAGIAENVLTFMEKADEAVVVVTPEPTSMADAYSLIKALVERADAPRIMLMVNRAASIKEAKATADKLISLSQRYLGLTPTWGGFLLEDATVQQAVRARRPFAAHARQSIAARSVALLADRVEHLREEVGDVSEFEGGRIRRWFERLFN